MKKPLGHVSVAYADFVILQTCLLQNVGAEAHDLAVGRRFCYSIDFRVPLGVKSVSGVLWIVVSPDSSDASNLNGFRKVESVGDHPGHADRQVEPQTQGSACFFF